MDSGQSEFKSWPYHLLAMWAWSSYFTFWGLSFIILKKGNGNKSLIGLLQGLNEIT